MARGEAVAIERAGRTMHPGMRNVRPLAHQGALEPAVAQAPDAPGHRHEQGRRDAFGTVDDRQQQDQGVPEDAVSEAAHGSEESPDARVSSPAIDAETPVEFDRVAASQEF